MSCCGMPRKSDEPEYPVPTALLSVMESWERYCPGIYQAVGEDVAGGDWDRQEGMFVPAYTLEGAFRVAGQILERHLVQREAARLHREGPWLVRLGLSKAPQTLSEKDRAFYNQAIQSMEQVLAAELEAGALPDKTSQPWGLWNGATPTVEVTFEGFGAPRPNI